MMRQPGPEDVELNVDAVPHWYVVLRGLREAAGVTQEGWAAYLGYGRRTLQRWERGDNPPDATATEELVQLCFQRGLFRTYRQGSLAGLTVTADLVRELMAGARLHQRAKTATSPAPFHQGSLSAPEAVIDLRLLREFAHNLPFELTGFVGRKRLLRDVCQHLESSSIVTLTGVGGVGKTRLALRVASGAIGEYSDGVWLAALDSVDDPALVSQTVAAAMGVRDQPGQSMIETLAEHLHARRLLLVVDNCEHVIESCAKLASHLLRASEGVRILATSREPLGVPGEVVLRVPPLTIPETTSGFSEDDLVATEAVQLFVARSQTSDPGFALTEKNAEAVARICRRLDGIPLAIELAAAWVRVLTPSEIDARLDDRFRLLSNGLRASPLRHQTLQAAVGWSYNLLSPGERLLFDRLSVFHGPFSLHAVESVCGHGDTGNVLDLVARLVDKSLLMSSAYEERDETEYSLLDTLRVFGEHGLRSRNEYDELRQRHAMWACAMADQVSAAIHGPDQRHWLQWIARHDGNIRAALNWAIEQQASEVALRLVVGLWWPWGVLGRPREARSWLERALALPGSGSDSYRRLCAHAMSYLGTVNVLQGDLVSARPILEDAAKLAMMTKDDMAILVARAGAALLEVAADGAAASREVEETLRLAQGLGSSWHEARLLEMQAQVAIRRGDADTATSLLDRGIRIARRSSDTWGLAQLLGNLGDAARSSGQHARARDLYQESLSLRASLGIPGIAPNLRHNLGYVALAERHFTGVRERFVEALNDFERVGDRRGMAECLIGLAGVSAVAGDFLKAATLFGAAECALESTGAQIWPSNQASYEQLVAMVRAQLATDAFATAYAEGRDLSVDEAVKLAIGDVADDRQNSLSALSNPDRDGTS